jgi:hypothetical protein
MLPQTFDLKGLGMSAETARKKCVRYEVARTLMFAASTL